MISSANLASHCKSVHKKKSRALKDDEKPLKPEFMNWKKYIKDPTFYTGHRYSELIREPEKFFEPDVEDLKNDKTVIVPIEEPKRRCCHAR